VSLTLVVADPGGTRRDAGRVLAAAERELVPNDELIWVGANAPNGVTRVPGRGGRGGYYAAGLAATISPLVSFTDVFTEPAPGWRAAAVGALEAGARVVGGPVEPTLPSSLRTLAGFLVEYGPHAWPPYTNAVGDVSANNVAYERDALLETLAPGGAVWKSVVDGSLRAAGHSPVVVPAMRVTSRKRYGWRDLGPARVQHGRLYGTQRSRTWSRPRACAAGLACAALPALAFARLAPILIANPSLRRRALSASPLVLLACAAWALGEADGYLRRQGREDAVF
jgi:hypothetical protein